MSLADSPQDNVRPTLARRARHARHCQTHHLACDCINNRISLALLTARRLALSATHNGLHVPGLDNPRAEIEEALRLMQVPEAEW